MPAIRDVIDSPDNRARRRPQHGAFGGALDRFAIDRSGNQANPATRRAVTAPDFAYWIYDEKEAKRDPPQGGPAAGGDDRHRR